MGEGGLGYLQKAAGILDTWEFLLGCYALVHLLGPNCSETSDDVHLSYVIIIGIFALLSLIIIISNCIGCCELPKTALMVFYIIAAIVVFLTACVCFSIGRQGKIRSRIGKNCSMDVPALIICLTMAIFYAYSAYNTNKGS